MRAHMEALREVLSPLGYPVYLGWAEGDAPEMPYLVLSAPSWDASGEAPVCGRNVVLDVDVRVKAVAGTTEGVWAVLARVRAVLSTQAVEVVPVVVPGRYATTQFVRSEFVAVDETVKITATDRHPVQGVETYRLVSQPL